jgi:sterol desaturase/sphingolipid hydroxylase (fatty acid hydroxylase superfamily)
LGTQPLETWHPRARDGERAVSVTARTIDGDMESGHGPGAGMPRSAACKYRLTGMEGNLMHQILPVVACAFLVAMALEWRVAVVRGVRLASAPQLASDLACGLLRLAVEALGKGSLLLAYAGLHAALAPFEWDAGHPLSWAAALLAYDFLYYWNHRLSHRIGFLWANHAVHHQTRDYHLAIGFRVGVLGPLLSLPFFAPLAVIGVPPAIYAGVAIAHAAVMFGLHARFVGDGGRLGLIFNTPSHHRIHHSAAAEHFDANFGGMLIVWDRWFGTFAPERRVGPAVEFGLPEGGRHLDPIAAQLWGWRQLGRQMQGRGVRGALASLFSTGPAAPARDAARPSTITHGTTAAVTIEPSAS